MAHSERGGAIDFLVHDILNANPSPDAITVDSIIPM